MTVAGQVRINSLISQIQSIKMITTESCVSI
jgi:hypothetical protein